MKYLQLVARLYVGGILVYAGFMKAVGPAAEFAAILETYKLFPSAILMPMAQGLPYIEMWVGLFILTGFCTRQAALAAMALSVAFFISVGSALVRHLDLVSCGCFGSDSLHPSHTLVLDALLFAFSCLIYRANRFPQAWTLDQRLN
jgi:uncharacterized membrane protein YphA (DoxX/SURF4 family)